MSDAHGIDRDVEQRSRAYIGDRTEEATMDDQTRVPDRRGASEPLLVTVREAARLLALGRSTVYELIAAGHLPTIHIGRSVRIRVADLDALISRLVSGDEAA
jgi:excisionase family DNA binding protein